MKKRNPLIMVPIFAAVAAAVYLMLVAPCSARLDGCRRDLVSLRARRDAMGIGISSRDDLEANLAQTGEKIAALSSRQLEPLLGSYAMRAKAVVGDLAAQAGLLDAEFSDRAVLALPVLPGSAVPPVLHARRLVAITCRGDYAAIVSFIMRVERDFPHIGLSALRISPVAGSPGVQQAEIVLEWPALKEASK